jgi:hypothetical protein
MPGVRAIVLAPVRYQDLCTRRFNPCTPDALGVPPDAVWLTPRSSVCTPAFGVCLHTFVVVDPLPRRCYP